MECAIDRLMPMIVMGHIAQINPGSLAVPDKVVIKLHRKSLIGRCVVDKQVR